MLAAQHVNPLTGTRGESGVSGGYTTTVEADPLGVNVGKEDPAIDPEPNGFSPDPDMPMIGGIAGSGCSSSNPYCKKCNLDGARVECTQVMFLSEIGAAVVAPSRTMIPVRYRGQPTWAFFNAYSDGYQGFVPVTANYIGDGNFMPSGFQRPGLHGHYQDTNFGQLNGATGEAELGRSSDTFFEHGGFQQTPQNPEVPLTPDQITAIRNHIAGLLTDKCARFIDQLVSSQTGKPYDSKNSLLKDFNSIKDGKGGFFFGGQSPRTGGDTTGSLANGTGKIHISNSSRFTDSKMAYGAAFTTLHELIHAITGAPDRPLSEQVRKLGITVYQRPGEIVPYPTDLDNRNLAFSGYWGQALVNACDPNYGKRVIYLRR